MNFFPICSENQLTDPGSPSIQRKKSIKKTTQRHTLKLLKSKDKLLKAANKAG